MKNESTLFALPLYLIAILALTLSFSIPGFAQSTAEAKPVEITYYDKDWKQVTDQKKAAFFRQVFKTDDPEKVLVKDHYISGQLQEECTVTDYDSRNGVSLARDGSCKSYGPDGTLEDEGIYSKGKRNGIGRTRRANGDWEVGYYVDDEKEGQFNIVDDAGVFKGRRTYSGGIQGKYFVICQPDEDCLSGLLEEFSDPNALISNGWVFDDSASLDEPTGLLINLSENQESVQTNDIELNTFEDWTIATRFKFLKPKGKVEQGLYFLGTENRENFISFTISADGTFSISERRNRVERPLVERRRSDAIRKGDALNDLEVTKGESGYEFRINDVEVYRIESLRSFGGIFGLYSGKGKGQVSISSILFVYPAERPEDISLTPPSWWSASGSGFIVSTDGYIVTNHHVIDGATRIEVDVRTGDQWKSVTAEVVAFDAASDLAILKLDAESLRHIKEIPFPVKGQIAELGTKVFTLGFPATRTLGDEMKFSEGSVSSRSGFKGDVTAYQVSVPIHGGNSGGPLFDVEGNLIGVINANVPTMQNVGYAIKSSYLIDMIKSMDNGPKIPTQNDLEKMSQIERIKALSELVVFIKVKD